MSAPNFIEVLEIAQRKEKFTPEVQAAAEGIDVATLNTAIQVALAVSDTEAVDNADLAAALKAGFEFAIKAVLMLKSAPSNDEKTQLYVNFKIGNAEEVKEPGTFDFVKKHLYAAWKKSNHISAQKAQVLYIQLVDELIKAKGTQ